MHRCKRVPTIRKTHVLQSTVELKVDTKKREISFKRIHTWINRQVLPSLFILKECLGIEKLDELISSSHERLSDLQKKMIKKYQSEQEEYEKWIEDLNKIG